MGHQNTDQYKNQEKQTQTKLKTDTGSLFPGQKRVLIIALQKAFYFA